MNSSVLYILCFLQGVQQAIVPRALVEGGPGTERLLQPSHPMAVIVDSSAASVKPDADLGRTPGMMGRHLKRALDMTLKQSIHAGETHPPGPGSIINHTPTFPEDHLAERIDIGSAGEGSSGGPSDVVPSQAPHDSGRTPPSSASVEGSSLQTLVPTTDDTQPTMLYHPIRTSYDNNYQAASEIAREEEPSIWRIIAQGWSFKKAFPEILKLSCFLYLAKFFPHAR
ncbi:hypothetical protein PGT21_013569 [Puccinia graminis f. sp. tritici]|uniref:Uncharacterized protein n=1 Tax=Puccinia graminis f. sp. tritici TaxID=56615 RepID=A0A5B0QT25_PUCGR|nr:hypothetical protein PGT21_013569 [Puccinia graminis f. sp. tritici]